MTTPFSPNFGEVKERLSLHILNCVDLVKEHVETRKLFTDLQPNIEQGRIRLWVDIFPKSEGDPGEFCLAANKKILFIIHIFVCVFLFVICFLFVCLLVC